MCIEIQTIFFVAKIKRYIIKKSNPKYFIEKEIMTKNGPGGFISLEQKADMNRSIVALKYEHLFEAGVFPIK